MEQVKEACKSLDMTWLPPQVGPFSLVVDQAPRSDTVYGIFHYESPAGWRWDALYDKELRDYMIYVSSPLVEFTDISFTKEQLEPFWALLQERGIEGLTKLLVTHEWGLEYNYTRMGIHTWDYTSAMPLVVGDFQRNVTPDKPVRMINGSYIIGEYHRPQEKTGIILFYNSYREEFFGEIFQKGTPLITHDLDGSSLKNFQKVLEENLENLLRGL